MENEKNEQLNRKDTDKTAELLETAKKIEKRLSLIQSRKTRVTITIAVAVAAISGYGTLNFCASELWGGVFVCLSALIAAIVVCLFA